MRSTHMTSVLAGTCLLATMAGAQTVGLQNGGFETPSLFGGGAEPTGWHNLSGGTDSRYRRVGDGLTPQLFPVGTPNALTPNSGDRCISIGATGVPTDFRGFTTDTRNFFAPGFPFYDPQFDYNGGAVVIEGHYMIPADQPVIGQEVFIKLNVKGAGDPNQDNATQDPFTHGIVGGPTLTVSGTTNGQWYLYRAVWCIEDIQAQVQFYVNQGEFTLPPNPNRVKITIGRFGAGASGASGLVFWDDMTMTQLAAGTPCPAPFAGPETPACPADFNQDGDLNPDDLGDFITCYFTEPPCPGADYNADNDVNPDDLGDFITAYFTGC